ncbi:MULTISPECIES: type I-B CRISPR-associated protein Cas8b/Csh1 [Clostridium]|uniref:type I-B CRISPR-associated protein Cas8b/Csh1 n=1 Tax=Clostridium TaxID=1485 RepID=UPI00241E02F0|nr:MULTISPECIES: type I-B CRISPR-associated protein Cas8b/Csh1 [Clostridium]MDU3523758.1 type I-B CRISPR-associated protein Cas8b/Csh1 [Clostridium sp.]MDU4738152.1 type I-B CRISPR-associated protein Cas8b/Csh1 [Clostridium sp.]
MLKECLEIFENELHEKGENLILDSYIPADGTYIVVSKINNKFQIKDEAINIKYNKKTDELEGRMNTLYEDICFYDYNSKLVDMNKPIDKKKIIQSNNYLSFFIKKDSLTNGKLTVERIDQYYDTLANPYLKYTDSKTKEIYKEIEEELGEIDKDNIKEIRNWIKENIFNLNIEIKGKDYLKIFFEFPRDLYEKEGRRYLIPNIFNSNDFNIKINNEIVGLPNNNMGLNSKKPYLENKSRKNTIPYLLNSKEVKLQKKFFDYLLNCASAGKVNIYLNDKGIKALKNSELPDEIFSGIFLRVKKGKEAEIHLFDIITGYNPKVKKIFVLKDVCNMENKELIKESYGVFRSKKSIQEILDSVLFSKYLKNNYFTEPGEISINDGVLLSSLLISRNAVFNWLYKGKENGVYTILNKVSLNIIKGSINKGFLSKSKHQFNLMCSINEYFNGGINMADKLNEIRRDLREKINFSETKYISSDEEYYFAVGQLINYLLSKSKGKNKPQSLVNPFINAKNNLFIKEKLLALYKKYNYDIEIKSKAKRFNNLYTMILGYEPLSEVNQNMIIAGYLNSSLMYEKSEEEK